MLDAAKHNGPTEFVSYFVRGEGMPNPSIVEHKARLAVARPYRMTMDYYEDWIVLNKVLGELGEDASTDQICNYLDFHTSLLKINQLPTRSLYTCAFNSAKTIGQTINSVLPHLADNDEYIIVNDGSTDNTLEEIAKFRDPRIKLISNEQNLGLASSSNIAINKARGKYIMRVDADDVLLPEFGVSFFHMFSEITKGAVVVYPAYHRLFENGIEWNRTISGKENHHAGCALMLRSAINEFRFKDELRHWDGLELYKRISQKNGAVAYCSIPTFLYRISNVSMSKSEPDRRAEMLITLGLKGLASA
jgi:glycosyltransferase involved in cell wall biosynthesis